MDKTGRNGLRVGDLESPHFQEKYDALKEKHLQMLERMDFEIEGLDEMEKTWMDAVKFIMDIPFTNSEYYINNALNAGKRILAEGRSRFTSGH